MQKYLLQAFTLILFTMFTVSAAKAQTAAPDSSASQTEATDKTGAEAEPEDNGPDESSNEFGVKGGVVYSRIVKMIHLDKEVQSINFGLVYQHKFNKSWGLSFEPGYMTIGVQRKSFTSNTAVPVTDYPVGTDPQPVSTSDTNIQIRYVNLPIMLGWYPVNGDFFFGAQAGLAFNYYLGSTYKEYAQDNAESTTLSPQEHQINDPANVTMDAVGGLIAGANITDKFTVAATARFAAGLDNVGISDAGRRAFYVNGQVLLTYRFKK
ncbi:MAG: outer membrane beta-barrel protein [Bacteroidota bacterium]